MRPRLARGGAIAAIILGALALAAPAGATGWSSVQTLGTGKPGANDAGPSAIQLAAAPGGVVGLAFQGTGSSAQLARRPVDAPFGTAQTLTLGGPHPPGATKRAPYARLAGLALPGPSAVLVAVNPDDSEAAQVQSAPGAALTAPQRLIPGEAGNGATGTVQVVSTPRGEVIASEQPALGIGIQTEALQTLARGASRFGPRRSIGRVACGATTGNPLAVDARGTAFLIAYSACTRHRDNVLRFARRSFGGRPRVVGTHSCPLGCMYALGAGGNGQSAVGLVLGHHHASVDLAVGRRDRLGTLHRLVHYSGPVDRSGSADNLTLDTPSVTPGGAVSFSWVHCRFMFEDPCTVSAVRATAAGRVGRPQRLKAVGHGQYVEAIDGPRQVFVAVCHGTSNGGNHCVLREWSAGPGLRLIGGRIVARGFEVASELGAAAPRPLAVDTDAQGDELLPLVGDGGSVQALVKAAGARRFTERTLAPAGTFPLGSLAGVVTTRREAVIAWMGRKGTVQAASDGF